MAVLLLQSEVLLMVTDELLYEAVRFCVLPAIHRIAAGHQAIGY